MRLRRGGNSKRHRLRASQHRESLRCRVVRGDLDHFLVAFPGVDNYRRVGGRRGIRWRGIYREARRDGRHFLRQVRFVSILERYVS